VIVTGGQAVCLCIARAYLRRIDGAADG